MCVCVCVEKFLCIVTGRDSSVQCRTGRLWGRRGYRSIRDGGSRQNCHDSLGPLGIARGKLQGGWGQRTMGIDRSVQSGLKSSASHGVHGQAVGVGRSVRSSQTARSPWPSPPGM